MVIYGGWGSTSPVYKIEDLTLAMEIRRVGLKLEYRIIQSDTNIPLQIFIDVCFFTTNFFVYKHEF